MNTFLRRMARQEKKGNEIADNMVACLGKRPDSYMRHMILPRLKDFRDEGYVLSFRNKPERWDRNGGGSLYYWEKIQLFGSTLDAMACQLKEDKENSNG